MKILLLIPITGLDEEAIGERLVFLRSIARFDTEISHIKIKDGPPAIETSVDHTIAAAEVIKCLMNIKENSFDAVIIWCAGDPGVDAARTLIDKPVIGPGESMRLIASILGKKVVGIPAPMPVLDLRKDVDKTFQLVKIQIEDFVREGYDSFYLDCLGMFGMGAALRKVTGHPVIDPAEASLKIAELMVELGLQPSRIAYPKFPPKHREIIL